MGTEISEILRRFRKSVSRNKVSRSFLTFRPISLFRSKKCRPFRSCKLRDLDNRRPGGPQSAVLFTEAKCRPKFFEVDKSSQVVPLYQRRPSIHKFGGLFLFIQFLLVGKHVPLEQILVKMPVATRFLQWKSSLPVFLVLASVKPETL